MTHQFNKAVTTIRESFKSSDMDMPTAYEIFRTEYEKSTGISWSYEKFLNRSYNWDFYGDDKGFIAVRPQKSGFVKLVSVAGRDRSKYKGLKELMSTGLPVWGAVDVKVLSNLENKKVGYIKATPLLVKILIKTVGKNMFGDANIVVNKDGTLNVTYSDIGTVTKVFIASPEYYKKLMSDVKLPKIIQLQILKLLK